MDVTNTDLVDALDNPAMVPAEDGEAVPLTLFTAARTVLWNMPAAELTLGDSEFARDALRGMQTAEQNGGVWAAGDELHRWTLKQLRTHAPKIFGVNAICVVEAFDQ